mmetsp:Transcript_17116/g.32703  ORF Transcript_17116/g.32703 Transcript_17116/m.32703 type:complete len:211 (+) Transcript_17116:125-757(+)
MSKVPALIYTSTPTQSLAIMLPLIIAPLVQGWMPRLSTCSGVSKALANGVRSGIDSLGGKSISLFMNNGNNNNNGFDEEKNPRSDEDDFGPRRGRFEDGYGTLFFAEDDELHSFVSRLEALYGMNSDSSVDGTNDKAPKPFWEDEERLILEGWMDWTEGPCLDECCGFDCDEQCEIPEEYKLTSEAPKVDVMSFLGIRRAEPLRVGRDWD